MERYGFSIIDQSESLFFYDSKLIIESLVILEESQSQKLKWLFGLLVIDSIMEDFGLTLYEKKSLIENLKNNFGVEMGIDKNLRKQLSLKYQKNKLEIFNFLDKNTFVDEDTRLLKSLIKNKSKFAINDIRIIKDYEKDSNNINNIIASRIHMGMNRLFRTKNRQTEFVSYQMLYYYYESIIARSKYDKQLINVKSIENQ